MKHEILKDMKREFPEHLTMNEADEYANFNSFETLEDALDFLKLNPDLHLYTQVDDGNTVVYIKGRAFVNRTGWYIVIGW